MCLLLASKLPNLRPQLLHLRLKLFRAHHPIIAACVAPKSFLVANARESPHPFLLEPKRLKEARLQAKAVLLLLRARLEAKATLQSLKAKARGLRLAVVKVAVEVKLLPPSAKQP